MRTFRNLPDSPPFQVVAIIHQRPVPLPRLGAIERDPDDFAQRLVADTRRVFKKMMKIDAANVRLDKDDRLIEAVGQHGGGGIRADSREADQFCLGGGDQATVIGDDFLSCLVKILGAAIIAQATPSNQDVGQRGRGEAKDIRKTGDKAVKLWDHPLNLGLLQHQLANQNKIGIGALPPGHSAEQFAAPLPDEGLKIGCIHLFSITAYNKTMKTYVLAGGCFWCLDAVYRRLQGVTEVITGYTGGFTDEPTYHQVTSGKAGHAEAVQVTFDETVIPKEVILDLFFLIHDPTTLNRQGADEGRQYRSAMSYAEAAQEADFAAALQRAKSHWGNHIVTVLEPFKEFYPAEDEHQDYFNKNIDSGYCSIVITPKIIKARATHAQWFKEV